MKYMLMIYETQEDFELRATAESRQEHYAAFRAWHRAMVDAGVYVDGSPLRPVETGTTVRVVDGKRHVQDGPYAETKEQLGGFTILDVPSLDAALEWASQCPTAKSGAVEVRPLALDTLDQIING